MSASEPISRAAVLAERYRSRLPHWLDDLAGPAHGTVQLPLHVVWSGLTTFDVDRPKRCMSMYHIVLTEGQRGDLTVYLNRRGLRRVWPVRRGDRGAAEMAQEWSDDLRRRLYAETFDEDNSL